MFSSNLHPRRVPPEWELTPVPFCNVSIGGAGVVVCEIRTGTLSNYDGMRFVRGADLLMARPNWVFYYLDWILLPRL